MSVSQPSTVDSLDSVGTWWLWGAVGCIVECLPASLSPRHSMSVECPHPSPSHNQKYLQTLPDMQEEGSTLTPRSELLVCLPSSTKSRDPRGRGCVFSTCFSELRTVPGISVPQSQRQQRREQIYVAIAVLIKIHNYRHRKASPDLG